MTLGGSGAGGAGSGLQDQMWNAVERAQHAQTMARHIGATLKRPPHRHTFFRTARKVVGWLAMDQPETAGQHLLRALSKADDPFALTVLIVEAARIADRLENLDDPSCPGLSRRARSLSTSSELIAAAALSRFA